MKYFGSVKNIKEASVDELMHVLPRGTANLVYERFRSEVTDK